jgi:hypothetical protein
MNSDTENPAESSSQPQSSRGASPDFTDSSLTADLALSVLKDRNVAGEMIEQINRNAGVMKSRKLRLAVAGHPRTPRRIALRLIRELYTFDLLQFSLLPAVASDLKRIADELLVARLASVSLGERISLARRSSARVAAALLMDGEPRVWRTALGNPRLAEAAIVKALLRANSGAPFVDAVSRHAKWCLRPEIRMALLRNAHTPLARALEFARGVPSAQLHDVLHTSRLPEKIKAYLGKEMKSSGGG